MNLLCSVYEEIRTLFSTIAHPNVRAVSDHLAGGVVSLTNQLTNFAKAYVKPSHDYLERPAAKS